MIERILQCYRSSQYDFRVIGNPGDRLAHLFADWVPYYRLKAAITQVLAPRRILEIGVRYGYSGAAFLQGAPGAHYTGIDLDSDSFGGTKGAIEWARKILLPGQFDLLIANTQTMQQLPGGVYDLIHVDGQQDGDGTFHDLKMAIRQGRHVLVDGYLWNAQNFRAASEFLFSHREEIEYYSVIPGYAGELLIKVNEAALLKPTRAAGTDLESSALRETYDASYYLRDCGGWDSFAATHGRELRDARLRSVFDLAMMRRPQRVLDLGCGRGELAYQAAAQGCEVVALDYSPPAIEIAKNCLEGAPAQIKERITFLCEDATRINLSKPVDVAIAGDLVEHMASAELDRLYETVAGQLTPGGMFVVHTFPNKWFYDYDYPRRRRIAQSVGAYLPPDPRTRYEKLMHINEQSPRVLRRQLKRYFPHVLLWFGSPQTPFASLGKRYSHRALAAERDLFALASTTPMSIAEVANLCRTADFSPNDLASIRLETQQSSLKIKVGGHGYVELTLRNDSPWTLNSHPPRQINLSYHWLHAVTREVITYDGVRTPLAPSCPSHSSRKYAASFNAPSIGGDYILQLSLVQEGVCWFHNKSPSSALEIAVAVR